MLREAPMMLTSGLAICCRCIFDAVKKAEVVFTFVLLQMRLPFLRACMPRNTLGTSFVCRKARHISHVFALRSFPQIFKTVVVAVTIDMVKTFPGPSTVHHRPHNSMSTQYGTINADNPIAQRKRTRPRIFLCPPRRMPPIQMAGRPVISKYFVQPIY